MSARNRFVPHLLPVIIAASAIGIAIAGEQTQALLRYQREAIFAGEWWRLFTGHLVHLGNTHTVMNVLGLALVWGLLWQSLTPLQWLFVTLGSAGGIGLGLLWLNPELAWYVGLSGLLHGLFVAGVLADMLRGGRREVLLLAAIAVKLMYEQFSGPLPGTAEFADGPVVVDAHLYGAIAGMSVTLLLKPWLGRFNPPHSDAEL